jgi:hypothetical protein
VFPFGEILFAPTGIVIAERELSPESLHRPGFAKFTIWSHCAARHMHLDIPPMAAGTRNVRIFVSEQCFDLLVDAMAAYSKEPAGFRRCG